MKLLYLLIPFLFLPIITKQYSIIQSCHYEVKKYLLYNYKRKIIFQVILWTLYLISNISKYCYFICFLLSLIVTNIGLINKEKLKMTNRVKRYTLIYFLVSYFILIVTKMTIYKSIFILNTFIIFYILIIHFIATVVEKQLRYLYKKEAQKIIKNKTIIGISGSYGKTSCKNIIYDLLSQTSNVSKTPKSYNTEIGIIKSIRECVNNLDEYFICEYGVDRVNSMNKLMKIVKPNVTLITEIGPQHLLTFKNIENILNEKIKLAKVLKKEEYAVINNDNEYLNKSVKQLNCKVITYGIKNTSDIMAKNIQSNIEGSTFDLYVNNKKITEITIRLLSEHNIYNFLGAIGVLKALNKPLDNIKEYARKVQPTEHRLELKKINDIPVIDDSFNSNVKGFKMAIDVLTNMNKKRIIITPGIIEQGKENEKVNYELGEYMAQKIDVAILVGKNSNSISKGLEAKKIGKGNIIYADNFIQAWNLAKQINEDKIILIENDLPSIYLK